MYWWKGNISTLENIWLSNFSDLDSYINHSISVYCAKDWESVQWKACFWLSGQHTLFNIGKAIYYSKEQVSKELCWDVSFFGTNRTKCTGGSFDRDVLEKVFKWLKDSRKIQEKGMGFDVYLIWINVVSKL